MSIFDVFKKRKKLAMPWAKYYSQEDLNYKLPNISMYDQLKQSSERYIDLVAMEYFGNKITYGKFIKQIDKTALSLKKMGVKKGDIVTLCMPNIPEVLYFVYGLNKIGAIANMLHPLSAEEEIKETLVSTKSEFLVMIDLFLHKTSKIIKSTDVKQIIKVSASDSMPIFMKIGYNVMNTFKNKESYTGPVKVISFSKFLNLGKIHDDVTVKFGKDTPAVILHSGGTSGKPKNVILQNRAFTLIGLQEHIMMKYHELGDTCLSILPNFHGFGLGVSMHAQLVNGVKIIMIPQFDAKKFDLLLKKYKPTLMFGVPTLYEALLSNNNCELDLSCLKHAISGGDKLPKILEDKVNDYFKKHNSSAVITQGYGMSEALSAVTLCLGKVNKSGSIGIPLPGNYIKIVDISTRKEVPHGTVGEICIHNKGLMIGYLNNESETNEALQLHDDGYIWLHSGDLGKMDEDGFVFCEGRAKRMIITSGYNVYPSHIEEVIESHPAVLQCSVVGVPHSYKQEVPKAFIVLKDGYHGLFVKQDIKDYCRKKLAKYMIPQEFVIRKKLPKTKIGKVDFKALQNDFDDDEE